MTEPRNTQGEPAADSGADRDPEVRSEVIKDLDVPSEDEDALRGGTLTASLHAPHANA